MANLMFDAWAKHGISPSQIYSMDKKEVFLLSKFYEIELEERVGGDR